MSEKQIMPVAHRDTNLELFRCITMLLIIAHHYVVSSGLLAADSPVWENPCSWRSLFILAFGAFGKTGINCFVLITGYYMCMSRITPRKYFKLLAEVYFYRIVISSFFALSGYQPFTARILLRVAWPFMSVGTNFTSCFLLFYLAIPFLSILAQKTTTRQHMALVCLCLFIYTFLKGIPKTNVPMNYVSWFTSLFFIASFMRLRMNAYMKTKNSIYEWGGLAFMLIVDISSVVAVSYASTKLHFLTHVAYLFMGESSMLLPLLTGIMAFVVFKKMRLRYIAIVNIFGGATFGIFLIHTCGDTMRRWLWRDFLHNVEMYSSPWLAVHAIGSVLAIFIVCAAIDRLRIRFIEPPIMACFDKVWPSIVKCFNNIENWFTRKTRNFVGG